MRTNQWLRPSRPGVALLGAAVAALLAAPAAAEVIATGLNNPRGLAFGPLGGLYVVEAGHGGSANGAATNCVPSPDPGPVRCFGATGAVVRVDAWGGKDPTASWERVVTGLPSIAQQVDDPATPPNDVGSRAAGPFDIGFLGWDAFLLLGFGGDPAWRADLAKVEPKAKLLGTILDIEVKDHAWPLWGKQLRSHGARHKVIADIVAHEAAKNPDQELGGAVDSNPYGLEVLHFPPRFVVADAGGNDLVEAWFGGRTRTLAVFAPRCLNLTQPPLAQAPGGGPGSAPYCAPGNWYVQSVPTSVTRGPDWALYTTELTGFPFPEGAARVHRTLPFGQDSGVHLEGFTNVIDLAFDHAGNAYVLEVGHRLPPFPPVGPGRLIRVDATTGARATLRSDLTFPGGVAIGPDGAAYVTNFGSLKGLGQVVRIALP